MDLLKILVKCGIELTDEVKENIKQAQAEVLKEYVKKAELENKQQEVEAYKTQVDKLKQDKTALNDSLNQSKEEFQNFKTGLEKEKANTEKTSLLNTKFKENGLMNENLIKLLLGNMNLDTIEVKDNDIIDFPKIIDPIKEEYKDFFGEVKIEGKPPIIPKAPNKPNFTLESIQNMTTEEINANWDTVQAVLQQK